MGRGSLAGIIVCRWHEVNAGHASHAHGMLLRLALTMRRHRHIIEELFSQALRASFLLTLLHCHTILQRDWLCSIRRISMTSREARRP